MKMRWLSTSLLTCLVLLLVGSVARTGDDDSGRLRARLTGYEETPAVSTVARGEFRGRISEDGTEITYRLIYSGLESAGTVAHIHFGQKGVMGGVVAFLCGGGGKPACPATGGTVTGTIVAADVIGPAAQGIAAGQFDEFIRAIRRGVTYANVHSATFSAGEIRGQIDSDDH